MIPKTKFDLDAVQKLSDASNQEIVDIADQLLEWLEDANWPVFKGVLSRLSQVGDELLDPIEAILEGSDSVWKANIVGLLIPEFKFETQLRYRAMLEKLADSKSQEDLDEYAIEYAKERLDSFSQNT